MRRDAEDSMKNSSSFSSYSEVLQLLIILLSVFYIDLEKTYVSNPCNALFFPNVHNRIKLIRSGKNSEV